jgi:tripartite-type tricarboxylate transporter receptor subunit TctC
MGDDHLAILQFEKLTGTTLAVVGFDSSSAAVNALLGGHIDVDFDNVGAFLSQAKGGAARVLCIMDKVETRYYPGVKTCEAQGVKLYSSSTRTIVMPAGAPKEVVTALSVAIRKAMDDPEHQKKLDDLGFPLKYADPEQTAVIWDEMEAQVKPFVSSAKK